MIFISGVFYDATNAPGFLKGIASALPLKPVIDGLSGAMVTGAGIGSHVTQLGIIAAWSVIGVTFAIRGFSWEIARAS